VTSSRAASRLLVAVVLVAAFALPGSLLSQTATNASAYSPINILFDHPVYGAVGKDVMCTIRMYGGPAADTGGQYNWTAEITASNNDTGAAIVPSVGSATSTGVWVVNVTLPGEGDQTVTVTLTGTSKASTGTASVTVTSEFEIKVVEPIVIKATVSNTGDVDAKNVTAKVFADGILLYTQVINITAGASTTITYNWTFLEIKGGRHIVTVTVDDPGNLVEFNSGNNVYTQVIYIGTPGNPAGVVLTIGVIIAAILVVLMWMQKPVRRPLKKQ